MQIILLEKIANLGNLGDVVKVSRAEYQQNTGLLIVNATSSDEAAPPKMTAVGFDVNWLHPDASDWPTGLRRQERAS